MLTEAEYLRSPIKLYCIFASVTRSIGLLKNPVLGTLFGSKWKQTVRKNLAELFRVHTAIQYSNVRNTIICYSCPYSNTSTTLLPLRKLLRLFPQIMPVVCKSNWSIQINSLFIRKDHTSPSSAPISIIFSPL